MSNWKVHKFREITEMNTFFAGGIIGGNDISWFGQSIAGQGGGAKDAPVLAGLTLIFTQPSAHTVTFVTGADPYGRLQFSEIKSQIAAGVAGLTINAFAGRLVLVETTPTNGVTITSAGTANSVFGFDTNASTVGKIYGTPFGSTPTAPYVGMAYSSNDNMHVVWTYE